MAQPYRDVWATSIDCATSCCSLAPLNVLNRRFHSSKRCGLSLTERVAGTPRSSVQLVAVCLSSSGALVKQNLQESCECSRSSPAIGNGGSGRGSSSGSGEDDCSNVAAALQSDAMEAALEIDEHERIRREKIGLANKGRIPWNKGKHHSPATIARLRERNKIVMQDPKIREKLRQHSHPQSQETREKLRIFMKSRMQFERKQLTIVQEWKDIISETARVGYTGDNEFQWDSYRILKEELRREYFAEAKKRKKKQSGPRSWTLEQRLRISESVRAKWDDPEYRKKVIESLREKRQKGQGRRRSNKKLSDTEFDSLLNFLTSTPSTGFLDDRVGSKVGSYNDPLSKEKLEKIKLLRVRNDKQKEQGLQTETRSSQHEGKMIEAAQSMGTTALQQAQREATERARILLAEAERAAILAAQALEAAGARDESLNYSLLEAQILLDEANKSISSREVETPSAN